MAKKKKIDEDEFDFDLEDEEDDSEEDFEEDDETLDEIKPKKYKKAKSKKSKHPRLVFTHEDDLPKELLKTPEEDEEEKAWEAEQKRIAALPPYDRFLLVVEDKLGRIEDGDIAEITSFDSNMQPLLKNDSTVCILRHISYLKVGDIVFHNNKYGKYSIRRIIKLNENEIYLLGDNENRYTVVQRDNIFAKVIAKIDGKKYTSFNTLTSKKKITHAKVASAAIRTLGRTVEATEEDLNYLQEQEKLKAEAIAKEKAAESARLVQSDKLENVEEAAIKTFSTTIDDRSGLEAKSEIKIAGEGPKEEMPTFEGFQTSVSNDLPGSMDFSIGGNKQPQANDDENYSTAGFQTSVGDGFEEAKSASFGSGKSSSIPDELELGNKKKKAKKKKKGQDDDDDLPIETNKAIGGFQTSTKGDSFDIPAGPDFGGSADKTPSFNSSSTIDDDDLPPIDFSK